MDMVLWNNEEQMVEILTDSTSLLLHPYLECEARWDAAQRLLAERGFCLPTIAQMEAIHRLLKSINGLILAHNGCTIKESWYWCRDEIPPFHAMYYDIGDGFDGGDLQQYTNFVRAVKDL